MRAPSDESWKKGSITFASGCQPSKSTYLCGNRMYTERTHKLQSAVRAQNACERSTPVTAEAHTCARARQKGESGRRHKNHGCAHRSVMTARIAEAFSTHLFSRSTMSKAPKRATFRVSVPPPRAFPTGLRVEIDGSCAVMFWKGRVLRPCDFSVGLPYTRYAR